MEDPKPYYGPSEDRETILLEQTFLAGDFISGVGYGVQLVLWTKCALHLWRTRKLHRYSRFLLAYITLLISIETAYMIAQAHTVQDVYIDNRNYPGGPWAYFMATSYLPENVVFCTTFFLSTFLCDILVLWRCWVIWSAGSKKAAHVVIALPAIISLTSFALGTLWVLQTSNSNLYGDIARVIGTVYYALSLGVNVILTILIVSRLLIYRRQLQSCFPAEPAQHYLSLSSMFIESASLFSILALIFIITYAINNPINQIFLGSATVAQQIAGYLIILRVAEGKAWENSSMASEMTLPITFVD